MSDRDKNGGVNHLQSWREFRQFTQEALAQSVGTTGAVISLLESGQRQLTAKWLRRLSEPLRTSPGFLLDHNPYDLDNDILEVWNRADPEARAQIKALAETVIAFRHQDAG